MSKINTLNEIVKEYSKYFKYFDSCECYRLMIYPSLFIINGNYKANKNEIIKYDDYYLSKPFKILKAPTFCIYFDNKTNPRGYLNLKRLIPLAHIDKIIKRYRSKLDYEIKKKNYETNKLH